MTIHEKALEAVLNIGFSENDARDAIQAYLTTLLDSPEMVDSLRDALDEVWKEGTVLTLNDSVDAIIAAIKKEAGCE